MLLTRWKTFHNSERCCNLRRDNPTFKVNQVLIHLLRRNIMIIQCVKRDMAVLIKTFWPLGRGLERGSLQLLSKSGPGRVNPVRRLGTDRFFFFFIRVCQYFFIDNSSFFTHYSICARVIKYDNYYMRTTFHVTETVDVKKTISNLAYELLGNIAIVCAY